MSRIFHDVFHLDDLLHLHVLSDARGISVSPLTHSPINVHATSFVLGEASDFAVFLVKKEPHLFFVIFSKLLNRRNS